MKKGLLTLGCAVALGICMYVCARVMLARVDQSSMHVVEGSRLPEIQWLRRWLSLDEAQFAKVQALHLAYMPTCEKLCARVQQSEAAALALSWKQSKVDPELAAAIQARAQVASECQQALLEHVYQTAACMNPGQAQLYLGLMIPHALGVTCCDAADGHPH